MQNREWTKPFHGVQHLEGSQRTHASVEDHGTWADWAVFQSYKLCIEGYETGPNAIQKARQKAERSLRTIGGLDITTRAANARTVQD